MKFLFKKEWYNVLSVLPEDIRLELYDCIMEYVFQGSTRVLKSKAGIAFSFIKQDIDNEVQRGKELSKRRSDAGKKAMANRWGSVTNDNKNNKCYQVITSDNKNNKCYDFYEEENNTPKDPKSALEVSKTAILSSEADNKHNKCYDFCEKENYGNTLFDEKDGFLERKESNKEKKELHTSIITKNINNNLDVNNTTEERKENKQRKERTEPLEVRQEMFYNSLVPYVSKYGKEMVRSFYDYWSEPNFRRTKMRFEFEKTWEVGRRLAKWNGNNTPNFSEPNKERKEQSQFQNNTEQMLRVSKLLMSEGYESDREA